MKALRPPIASDPALRQIPGLRVNRDADLSARTTMKMRATTEALVEVDDPLGLRQLVRLARAREWPMMVIGGGANTLFATTHFEGIVVQLGREFQTVGQVGANILRVGAGVTLIKLMKYSHSQGLMGLEFLDGIPGRVGGSLAGNAGAGNWGICDFVDRVLCMTRSGRIISVARHEFRYSYRYSELRECIVLEADFLLEPYEERECHRRLEDYRGRKAGQPLDRASAGCIFKNPKDPRTGEKVSAGKLIDQAGLKGYFVNTASVSTNHANFIVHDYQHGHATGEDFLALISLIQDVVLQRTGILLEVEVQIVGGPMNSAVLR